MRIRYLIFTGIIGVALSNTFDSAVIAQDDSSSKEIEITELAEAPKKKKLEIEQRKIEILLDQAQALFDQGEYETAEKLAGRVLEGDPTNPVAKALETLGRDRKHVKIRKLNETGRKKVQESFLKARAVVVSKPQGFKNDFELHIYDVADLKSEINSDIIKKRIRPGSWDTENGASIEKRSGKLIVMQRPEVHELIMQFLRGQRGEGPPTNNEMRHAWVSMQLEQIAILYRRGEIKAAEELSNRILAMDPFNVNPETLRKRGLENTSRPKSKP